MRFVADNHMNQVVAVDRNCNPFENYNADYFRMKNYFAFLKEVL